MTKKLYPKLVEYNGKQYTPNQAYALARRKTTSLIKKGIEKVPYLTKRGQLKLITPKQQQAFNQQRGPRKKPTFQQAYKHVTTTATTTPAPNAPQARTTEIQRMKQYINKINQAQNLNKTKKHLQDDYISETEVMPFTTTNQAAKYYKETIRKKIRKIKSEKYKEEITQILYENKEKFRERLFVQIEMTTTLGDKLELELQGTTLEDAKEILDEFQDTDSDYLARDVNEAINRLVKNDQADAAYIKQSNVPNGQTHVEKIKTKLLFI